MDVTVRMSAKRCAASDLEVGALGMVREQKRWRLGFTVQAKDGTKFFMCLDPAGPDLIEFDPNWRAAHFPGRTFIDVAGPLDLAETATLGCLVVDSNGEPSIAVPHATFSLKTGLQTEPASPLIYPEWRLMWQHTLERERLLLEMKKLPQQPEPPAEGT